MSTALVSLPVAGLAVGSIITAMCGYGRKIQTYRAE